MALGELLLVGIDFVQFATHLGVATTHLATENVTALGGGTRLTLDGSGAIPVNLSDHLHLIGVVHHKFLSIASVASVRSLPSRNNLALRSNSWDFIVILLYW